MTIKDYLIIGLAVLLALAILYFYLLYRINKKLRDALQKAGEIARKFENLSTILYAQAGEYLVILQRWLNWEKTARCVPFDVYHQTRLSLVKDTQKALTTKTVSDDIPPPTLAADFDTCPTCKSEHWYKLPDDSYQCAGCGYLEKTKP